MHLGCLGIVCSFWILCCLEQITCYVLENLLWLCLCMYSIITCFFSMEQWCSIKSIQSSWSIFAISQAASWEGILMYLILICTLVVPILALSWKTCLLSSCFRAWEQRLSAFLSHKTWGIIPAVTKALDFSSICPSLGGPSYLMPVLVGGSSCLIKLVEEVGTSFLYTAVTKEPGIIPFMESLKELFPNIHCLMLWPDVTVG